MTVETLDMCLNFASGAKEYQVAYGIRTPEFPSNLLSGKEKVVDNADEPFRRRVLSRKEQLYIAWMEFWKEAEPLRPVLLKDLCKDVLSEDILNKFEKNNVITVEDFLVECTTVPFATARKTYGRAAKPLMEIRLNALGKIREWFTHREDG